MSCRKGCGSSLGNIELIVKDLIRQMIEDGRLQEGIIDCEGKRLWRESAVVTCDILGHAVCQLAEEGALCFKEPESIVVDEGRICILFNDGSKTCTSVALTDRYLKATSVEGTVITLTMADNSTFKVDLGKMLKTITATAEETDAGYVFTGTNGATVTVPKMKVHNNGDGTATITDDGTSINVVTNPTKATKAQDGTVIVTNSDGSSVTIQKPLTAGDGIVIEDGVVKQAPQKCYQIDDLNDLPFTGVGIYCIKGTEATKNLPAGNYFQTGPVVDRGTTTNTFDWTGTATVSQGETIVTVSNFGVVWESTNDKGLTSDGRTPTVEWSKWRRVDNTPCLLGVKTVDANYTATATDDVIIVSGTRTVELPADTPVGKVTTVVNADTGTTTLTGAAGVTVIPPYQGSLKVTGENAMVTVIKTSATQYRVTGQTEGA